MAPVPHRRFKSLTLCGMRTVEDANRKKWKAELISHGQTSEYLNPRGHQPIIQFTCLDEARPRRYAALKGSAGRSLDEYPDEELAALFEGSSIH